MEHTKYTKISTIRKFPASYTVYVKHRFLLPENLKLENFLYAYVYVYMHSTLTPHPPPPPPHTHTLPGVPSLRNHESWWCILWQLPNSRSSESHGPPGCHGGTDAAGRTLLLGNCLIGHSVPGLPLPNAALAAIVVVALKGLYLQVRDIYKYYRLSPADMVSDCNYEV